MRSLISTLVERCKLLNIELEIHGNYPWIYLYSVNGNRVVEKFRANHGFTAFTLGMDNIPQWSDRREVFKIIRKYK
jgi:hypothetical protein